MIDTLIISGCGIKCIYYIGIYKSLLENKLISTKSIKNFICCSSGSLFGLCIILNYSLNLLEKIILSLDYEKILDYDDVDDIFESNGFFTMEKFGDILSIIIKKKFNKNDITLKELHNETKLLYIVKVYNYSLKKEEFISYKTDPDISLIKLIKMSCCIPIIFKPISYNNYIYIDGGCNGSIPYIKDKKFKNYIIFNIKNNIINKNSKNETIMEYLKNLFYISSSKIYYPKDHRFIEIICIKNIPLYEFSITNDDKYDMINYSKLLTDIHIYKYL
jgi:NTE family protein